MNRRATVMIVIIAAILFGGSTMLLVKKAGQKRSNASANVLQSVNDGASQKRPSKPRLPNSVFIENGALSPARLNVIRGTTVTWTNQDNATYTLTESDGQEGPSSSGLAQNKSYSFTYRTVGTFNYHVAEYPDLTGTVTVTE